MEVPLSSPAAGTNMSSVDYLRHFVCERLTAAAEEIFVVFERAVVELQAEIERQQRLLDPSGQRAELQSQDCHQFQEENSSSLEVKAELSCQDPPRIDDFDPPDVDDGFESNNPAAPQEPQMVDQQHLRPSNPPPRRPSRTPRLAPPHHPPPPPVGASSCSRLFTCHLCGKTFRVKRYLTQHLQSHEDETHFRCAVCHKSFRVKRYLAQHLKSHCRERQACGTCGKTFSSRHNLLVHESLHTGRHQGGYTNTQGGSNLDLM